MMSESGQGKPQPRGKREAEEKLRTLLAEAITPDRQLAEKLLLRRRTTFGIAMICLAPFMVAIAILFHDERPDVTPIVLLMATILLFVGALHVERVNIARRDLAAKILRRFGKLGLDRDQ